MEDMYCLNKLHLVSISHQDISADALEDTSAPKSKEADEGPKVGRVDVLHVRHRHLFNLCTSVTSSPLLLSWRCKSKQLIVKLLASYLCHL